MTVTIETRDGNISLKANKEQFVKSGLLGYLAFSIIVAL